MIFQVNGEKRELALSYQVNAGYAGADQESVKAHVEELRKVGVPAPTAVPTFYPVPLLQLTQDERIQVCGEETSGEIEYVLLVSGGKRYLTVGSDHSDRHLETYSVPAAKQICPNVIAGEAWEYDEVAGRRERIRLLCEVQDADGAWRIYQDGHLTDLLSADELLRLGKPTIREEEGLVLYSGTIPFRGAMCCAENWRITLEDEETEKKIVKEYRVEVLPNAVE